MGAREETPDLLKDWTQYERRLLTKIAYRERELLELHQDFIELQAEYRRYREHTKAMARRRLLERAIATAGTIPHE